MTDVVDVAVLSLGTTPGWRTADPAFVGLLRESGVTVVALRVPIGRAGRLRRHPAVTDLVEALAARHAATRLPGARAVVLSTVTAALLARAPDVPYAIRFDAPAAVNRPGAAGAWQRHAERRALARAPLLLPFSAEAAARLPVAASRVVPLPTPIEDLPAPPERDVDAVAYAGYPDKRGLDLLCRAWAQVGAGRRLLIGGAGAAQGRAWLARCGVAEPPGVAWLGALPRPQWLATVARARVFVNASRFEDHGLAQLEALASGCTLVTVPSPGPYPALALARALDERLVAAGVSAAALAPALRAGLALPDDGRRAYARRAQALLEPHRGPAIRRTLVDEVLPALGLR